MMQIDLADLFLSSDVWGLFGPFAVVAMGIIIVTHRKYKGLGIFWIIVESVMIAMYYDLAPATPFYYWNIFILIMGVVATVFQMASR